MRHGHPDCRQRCPGSHPGHSGRETVHGDGDGDEGVGSSGGKGRARSDPLVCRWGPVGSVSHEGVRVPLWRRWRRTAPSSAETTTACAMAATCDENAAREPHHPPGLCRSLSHRIAAGTVARPHRQGIRMEEKEAATMCCYISDQRKRRAEGVRMAAGAVRRASSCERRPANIGLRASPVVWCARRAVARTRRERDRAHRLSTSARGARAIPATWRFPERGRHREQRRDEFEQLVRATP